MALSVWVHWSVWSIIMGYKTSLSRLLHAETQCRCTKCFARTSSWDLPLWLQSRGITCGFESHLCHSLSVREEARSKCWGFGFSAADPPVQRLLQTSWVLDFISKSLWSRLVSNSAANSCCNFLGMCYLKFCRCHSQDAGLVMETP